MCGICGIVGINDRQPVDPVRLHAMNQTMVHRGPDDGNEYVRESVGLAHRRLSIIDLETGAQPMSTPNGEVTIVFNGEIYNYRELRQDLQLRGHCFKTSSDTEVILLAYVEFGTECASKLRGMFALAIHDTRNQSVFIARDRLGIKPLYYAIDNGQLIFGSELKAIVAANIGLGEIDLASIDFFVSVGYIPDGRTMFRNVTKLPAGHTLTIIDGRLSIQRYWDLNYHAVVDSSDEAEQMKELDDRLKETIQAHLVSDVPVGAFLSGGLDSSAIVALVKELGKNELKTFSLGYEDDPGSNELEYARLVARHVGTDHHEFIMTPVGFFDSINVLLEHLEEPLFDSSAVALFQLANSAREHVTVTLSGEGADEVFAGYPIYRIMTNVDRIGFFGQHVPEPVKGFVGRRLNGSEKHTRYWDWCTSPTANRYQSLSNDITTGTKKLLYSSAFREQTDSVVSNYFAELDGPFDQATRLQRMTQTDIKSWLIGVSLLKSDKLSMANSLEVRVPFLDHELVEYGCNLPDRFRIRGKCDKYLLKRTMEKYLPREVIYRKKQGFPVPIASWFRGELFERLREILIDRSTIERGYFCESYVTQLLNQHKSGQRDNSKRLYSLLVLELWHRKYAPSGGFNGT